MSSLEKLDGDFADESVEIREVWDSNLEEEFSLIRSIVDEYPFISMDTEFHGVPLRPVGIFRSAAEFHYCTLKSKVNHLNLIQLGLTFSNSSGRLPLFGSPPRPCLWQFNFREFDAASRPRIHRASPPQRNGLRKEPPPRCRRPSLRRTHHVLRRRAKRFRPLDRFPLLLRLRISSQNVNFP